MSHLSSLAPPASAETLNATNISTPTMTEAFSRLPQLMPTQEVQKDVGLCQRCKPHFMSYSSAKLEGTVHTTSRLKAPARAETGQDETNPRDGAQQLWSSGVVDLLPRPRSSSYSLHFTILHYTSFKPGPDPKPRMARPAELPRPRSGCRIGVGVASAYWADVPHRPLNPVLHNNIATTPLAWCATPFLLEGNSFLTSHHQVIKLNKNCVSTTTPRALPCPALLCSALLRLHCSDRTTGNCTRSSRKKYLDVPSLATVLYVVDSAGATNAGNRHQPTPSFPAKATPSSCWTRLPKTATMGSHQVTASIRLLASPLFCPKWRSPHASIRMNAPIYRSIPPEHCVHLCYATDVKGINM